MYLYKVNHVKITLIASEENFRIIVKDMGGHLSKKRDMFLDGTILFYKDIYFHKINL